MAARRTTKVRIGHLELTLLPGETRQRIADIAREVRERWGPTDIVEEFDCDTIIHSKFKVERYERFAQHFVKSGIAPEDIEAARRTYLAAIRSAERSLEIAREGLRRKPPARETVDEFVRLPVPGMLQ